VPLAAAVIIIWLLATLARAELIATLLFVVGATLVFGFKQRFIKAAAPQAAITSSTI
jgi:hypothetical protein